jgi:hypothetical protein
MMDLTYFVEKYELKYNGANVPKWNFEIKSFVAQ